MSDTNANDTTATVEEEQYRAPRSADERRMGREARRTLAAARPPLDRAEAVHGKVNADRCSSADGADFPMLSEAVLEDLRTTMTKAMKLSNLTGTIQSMTPSLGKAFTDSIDSTGIFRPIIDQFTPKITLPQFASAISVMKPSMIETAMRTIRIPQIHTVDMGLRNQLAGSIDIAGLMPKVGFPDGAFFSSKSMTGLMPTPELARLRAFGDTASAVNKALPRIDLSAYNQVVRITDWAVTMPTVNRFSTTAATLGMFQPPEWFHQVAGGLQETITNLLGRWSVLTGIGHTLAGRARRAALRARDAVLRGNRAAVAAFARVWLGLTRLTERVMEAVEAALLDPGWENVTPLEVIDTIQKIRKAAAHDLENLIGGKATGDLRIYSTSLDGEEDVAEYSPLWKPVADLERIRLEGLDPVFEAILEKLTPQQREIALVWSTGAAAKLSWKDAALECGATPEAGEAVRRKLKGLGQKARPTAA